MAAVDHRAWKSYLSSYVCTSSCNKQKENELSSQKHINMSKWPSHSKENKNAKRQTGFAMCIDINPMIQPNVQIASNVQSQFQKHEPKFCHDLCCWWCILAKVFSMNSKKILQHFVIFMPKMNEFSCKQCLAPADFALSVFSNLSTNENLQKAISGQWLLFVEAVAVCFKQNHSMAMSFSSCCVKLTQFRLLKLLLAFLQLLFKEWLNYFLQEAKLSVKWISHWSHTVNIFLCVWAT